MKIYIDDDFKCHVTDDGTMQEVETDFFTLTTENRVVMDEFHLSN